MIKNIVIGLLCYNTAQAIHKHKPRHDEFLEYRPYVNGRTPWYSTVPPTEPDFPYNYPVPNFGKYDSSIGDSLKHAAAAEERLKHKFNADRYDKNYIHPF